MLGQLLSLLIALTLLFTASCGKKDKDKSTISVEDASPEKAEASKKTEAPAMPDLERPAWILGDASGEGTCQVVATGLRCVGIASDDNKDAATLQALSYLLDEAAIITARAVQAEAEGKPWTPEDPSEVSEDAKLKARKSIDAVLGISPSAPPRHDNKYWEQYEESPFFKVYAEKMIGVEERKRIAESLLSPDQD